MGDEKVGVGVRAEDTAGQRRHGTEGGHEELSTSHTHVQSHTSALTFVCSKLLSPRHSPMEPMSTAIKKHHSYRAPCSQSAHQGIPTHMHTYWG